MVLVDSVDIFALGFRRLLADEDWPCRVRCFRHEHPWVPALLQRPPDLLLFTVEYTGVEATLQDLEQVCRVLSSHQIVLLFNTQTHNLRERFAEAGYTQAYLKTQSVDCLQKLVHKTLSSLEGKQSTQAFPSAEKANTLNITPRQMEILELLGEGLTVRQIAAALTLSPKTVETHCIAIRARVGVETHHDLVVFAVQHRQRP